MKPLALLVLAIAAINLFAGCASEDSGYYTPSQVAAQHSGYDPTDRIQSSVRY